MIGKVDTSAFPPAVENKGWARTSLDAFRLVASAHDDGVYEVSGRGETHRVVREGGAITVDGTPLNIG